MIKYLRDHLYALLAAILVVATIIGAIALPHQAHAASFSGGRASFSSARSFSSYSSVRVYSAPRVYVAPRPVVVVVRPRAVVVAPRPIYVAPRPAVIIHRPIYSAPVVLPTVSPGVDVSDSYGQHAPVGVVPVQSSLWSAMDVFLLILFILLILSLCGYGVWFYDPFDIWIDDEVVVY
ncbi:hypothetical protein ACPUER_12120 [Burkholderia sp. DN3021]|uniref:hypothetical protein n=1 Tax=Burkholderia sp. DN3021 TaxID=3410137 RepID=UPI003C7E5FDE